MKLFFEGLGMMLLASQAIAGTEVDKDVPPPADDICDIMGPVYTGMSGWVVWGVLLAIVLSMATWAFWFIRRRQNKIRAQVLIPLTPYEEALKNLESAHTQMREESASLFATALTQALRAYLERAFNMPAPECTTEEFLSYLASHHVFSDAQKQVIGHLLKQCDLAKFAKQTFSYQELDAFFKQACCWVDTVHQEQQLEKEKAMALKVSVHKTS